VTVAGGSGRVARAATATRALGYKGGRLVHSRQWKKRGMEKSEAMEKSEGPVEGHGRPQESGRVVVGDSGSARDRAGARAHRSGCGRGDKEELGQLHGLARQLAKNPEGRTDTHVLPFAVP